MKIQLTSRKCLSPATTERRKGLATVELAITLPLMLLIIMGIVETSRALDITLRLSGAVREGGRTAAADIRERLPTGWTLNQKIETDMRNTLRASGINSEELTFQITHAEGPDEGQYFNLQNPDNYLQYFRVTAKIPFSAVSKLSGRYLNNQDLTASVVFRMGRSSLSE